MLPKSGAPISDALRSSVVPITPVAQLLSTNKDVFDFIQPKGAEVMLIEDRNKTFSNLAVKGDLIS